MFQKQNLCPPPLLPNTGMMIYKLKWYIKFHLLDNELIQILLYSSVFGNESLSFESDQNAFEYTQ